MKWHKCQSVGGLEGQIVVYNGILLSNEKEWKIALCNNLDKSQGNYADVEIQPIPKRYILYDFIYKTLVR